MVEMMESYQIFIKKFLVIIREKIEYFIVNKTKDIYFNISLLRTLS